METKTAIAFTVLTFYVSLSVFHPPALGFPTTQELEQYQIASSSNDVDCSNAKDGEKIPNPNSCSEFYECDYGIAYFKEGNRMPKHLGKEIKEIKETKKKEKRKKMGFSHFLSLEKVSIDLRARRALKIYQWNPLFLV